MVGSLACLALAIAPAALAQYRGGVAPPESATDSGEAINEVYWVVFTVCAVVFVLVEAALVLFILRFRRRPGTPAHAEGPQIHGNTRLELLWTIVPALVLVGLAIYTFTRIPAVQAKPDGGAADNELAVTVEAHQFYWQYEYPNGALSFDTLYLPVGRPVKLSITSRDVPHSWWVPELTGKLDAIPGQINVLRFTVNRPGTYARGKCGEMCGIQHAVMLTRVEVMPGREFDRWLDDNAPPEEAVELGKVEWEVACAKCHGLAGEGDIGPPIAGNGTLTNRGALRTLLFEGQDTDANQGYMPPVGSGWSGRQIDALIAYVKSEPKLEGGEGGGG